MKKLHPSPAVERVLLVDDNEHGLVARKALLEEIGLIVVAVGSGEDALEAFSREPFQLVVTDYRMRGMNGAELIGHLRELAPKVPVILVSGFVEPLGLCESNTGADAVVVKNADEVTALMRCVNRLLNRPARKKPPNLSSLSAVTWRSARR
jgi:CheY-like chemotaxis protein